MIAPRIIEFTFYICFDFWLSNVRAQRRGRPVVDLLAPKLCMEKQKELFAPSVCSEWLEGVSVCPAIELSRT